MSKNKPNLKQTFVFDTRGTTIPEEAVSELKEKSWEFGERYISKQELEQLKALSQNDVHSDEYREYLKRSGPIMTQLLRDDLYVVSFYPDVQPTFEIIQNKGFYSRILSKADSNLTREIYKQAGLDTLLIGINSSVVDLSVKDKSNPGCYLALEKEVMIPARESFAAYTSDDPRETNACREAFPITKVDVFYIDRGQERKQDLRKGIKLIRDLREIL
ncbi:hypothetical protein KY342_00100 [Candidatus Woesearchaeota archaeon]|nr:hypothetical protein [Candidatus Woesearchaeota archaeon]